MNRLTPCLLLAAALTACSSTPRAVQLIEAKAAGQALAAAAPPEGQPLALWLNAERSRIDSERAAARQRFDDAEKVCWQRFAVNDCISRARTTRRGTLERLRQEDLALNAVERERSSAARLQRLEEKER
jgi:hypothetical protein